MDAITQLVDMPRARALAPRFRRIGLLPDHSLTDQAVAALAERSESPLVAVVQEGSTAQALEIDALISGWQSKLDRAFVSAFPHLRYVGMRATTLERVDTAYLAERGISLSSIRGYGDQGTAEFVIEHLLRDRRSAKTSLPREAASSTVGLVGLGAVGTMVARMALGLGCTVVCARRTPGSEVHGMPGVRVVGMTELLERSDYISFHTPAWQEVVSDEELALCSPSAALIVTTLGLPFSLEALLSWLKVGQRRAIFDLCAAHQHRTALEQCAGAQVVPLFAARTPESRSRADQMVLNGVDEHLARGKREV